MQIVINGEPFEVEHALTFQGLLTQLGKKPGHVAIEHNGDVVEPGELDSRVIQPNDRIEIVHFVGGG